jgi:hypothetical protein
MNIYATGDIQCKIELLLEYFPENYIDRVDLIAQSTLSYAGSAKINIHSVDLWANPIVGSYAIINNILSEVSGIPSIDYILNNNNLISFNSELSANPTVIPYDPIQRINITSEIKLIDKANHIPSNMIMKSSIKTKISDFPVIHSIPNQTLNNDNLFNVDATAWTHIGKDMILSNYIKVNYVPSIGKYVHSIPSFINTNKNDSFPTKSSYSDNLIFKNNLNLEINSYNIHNSNIDIINNINKIDIKDYNIIANNHSEINIDEGSININDNIHQLYSSYKFNINSIDIETKDIQINRYGESDIENICQVGANGLHGVGVEIEASEPKIEMDINCIKNAEAVASIDNIVSLMINPYIDMFWVHRGIRERIIYIKHRTVSFVGSTAEIDVDDSLVEIRGM